MYRLLTRTALVVLLSASSASAQDITRLAGDVTSDLIGRHAIQVAAPNVTSQERFDRQVSGFEIFHRLNGPADGLGPEFNDSSCSGCHVDNGRGALKFSRSPGGGTTMIIKVSLKGLNPDGSPKNIPGIGEQLRDHRVRGKPQYGISLAWTEVLGKYPDGTKYKLRKPNLNFSVPGINKRKLAFSLRMTPPVIGPGLLETVSDETILAMSDPNDADGDGISGKPQMVPNVRTGTLAIGRFGFRASHPTVEQQSAAALVHDIGVTNSLFPVPGEPQELSDDQLDRLTVYQQIAGVPPARDQSDPAVVAGKALFQTVGCDGCHKVSLVTGSTGAPELVDQKIHPFTDLLLHDMGPGLADKRAEYSAGGSEWRTTPLWGLGFSKKLSKVKAFFLHDGRARTIEEAILWHGGEATKSTDQFKKLSKADRKNLLAFLDSL